MVTDNYINLLGASGGYDYDANPLFECIYKMNVHQNISMQLAYNGFKYLLTQTQQPVRDIQLGIFLNGLMAKGPTGDEIIGILKAIFELDNFDLNNKIKVNLPEGKRLIGTVGSGKKGLKTVNISTAASIIAATSGTYVGKPGSSSTSSVTGSADILKLVGANIDISTESMIEVLLKTKFGFFKIENIIPNFDEIYGGRFYAPHALSLALPALISPIKFDTFVYGVAHPNLETSIKVFYKLGLDHIFAVSSTDDGIHYIDEVGIYGTTSSVGIKGGVMGEVSSFSPNEVFDLPKYSYEDIKQGASVTENILHFLHILTGKEGGRQCSAKQDIACTNAAGLIYLTGEAESLKEGFHIAKTTLKSGKALDKLIEFIEATGGNSVTTHQYLNQAFTLF